MLAKQPSHYFLIECDKGAAAMLASHMARHKIGTTLDINKWCLPSKLSSQTQPFEP